MQAGTAAVAARNFTVHAVKLCKGGTSALIRKNSSGLVTGLYPPETKIQKEWGHDAFINGCIPRT